MTRSFPMRPLVGALATVSMLAAGCGEDVSVSRDEAIEVLVLDGVPRDRAACIVDGADGVIELAKVTGVDADISEDELADLAGISATCVFVDDTGAGVIDAQPEGLGEAEGGGLGIDTDTEIERLITGGFEPAVARCVVEVVLTAPEPSEAAANDTFIAEAARICGG